MPPVGKGAYGQQAPFPDPEMDTAIRKLATSTLELLRMAWGVPQIFPGGLRDVILADRSIKKKGAAPVNSSMTQPGPDNKLRCRWCLATPQYLNYHDTEWGFPVRDDRRLFEKLCLEGFQSGLSWRTVLEKRENFRAAFHDFDHERIAQFSEDDVNRLLGDAGIIRHRGKITAVVNNAQRMIELLEQEGSLADFVWRYAPPASRVAEIPPPATSPESTALSRELKKRGWKFVGPTTVYSFMQAMGLVNDHAPECVVHAEVERARRAFLRS